MNATSGVDLCLIARRIRMAVIRMCHDASSAHLGSCLSSVDILVAAFWTALRIDPTNPHEPDRDRFILSKGHAAAALYGTLAHRGFFPIGDLAAFGRHGGMLAEQPIPGGVPGVEVATGSLGHGLSIGLGLALAGRLQRRSYRVFVVMSDGECNEGSVWEAAMLAAGRRLENLVVIIDYNKWQATGRSDDILALRPLAKKWEAFGWSASEVDGHDLAGLATVMQRIPDGSGRPVAVVAHTVKGKGVSFMEDDNNWHYRIPTADQVEAARVELSPL